LLMGVGALAAVTGVVEDPEEITDWSLLVAAGGDPMFIMEKILKESEKI
jgi:hypothetical protein